MCGRYSIYESMDHYLRELGSHQLVIDYVDPEPINRYNVAPTAKSRLIRADAEGIRLDAVKWGWAPFWAKGKRPDPINARIETVATGKFFKQLWPAGRVLVPANNWFEWVKDPNDPKKKQPYCIRLKSQAPMFFAGLAMFHPGLEPHDEDGFVIITDASDAGMVDIHDRRPVVLGPEAARQWIEPGLDAADALHIAQQQSRPVADFEWYAVSKAVGNVRNHGPELIAPSVPNPSP